MYMTNILFILLLIFILIIVFSYIQSIKLKIIGGGDFFKPYISNRVFIDDNEKLFIDGNNLIHYSGGDFNKMIKVLSKKITKYFSTQQKNIILKNSPVETNYKKYINKILKVSKEYPSIYYHIAYDDKAKKTHTMKGRDDFLLLKLVGNGYIISNDRFRDYNDFSTILPFHYVKILNGKIVEKYLLNPKKEKLKYPGYTKQLIYTNDKSLKLQPGDIIKQPEYVFSTIYMDL